MKPIKTTLSSNRAPLSAAVFAALALTCVTALAQNGPTLVFTEDPNSPLGLTAEVGGAPFGTVTPVAAGAFQDWAWSPPPGLTITGTGTPVWWIEPGSPTSASTTYNEVSGTALPSGVPVLEIQSDIGGATGNNIFSDGTLVSPWMTLGTATYGVQFFDQGDVPSSTVPDASSTLTLLGGALMLVGAVGRKLAK